MLVLVQQEVGGGQKEQAPRSLYTGDFKHERNPSFTQVWISECGVMCFSFCGIVMEIDSM